MLNLVKLLFAIVSALSLVSALPIIGLSKRGLSGVLTNCKKGYFALTFDDGPYQYTSELIDKLNTNGIKATFFVNGDNFWNIADTNAQAAIMKAYKSGHQIGSHTYTHADLDTLDAAGITKEMQQLDTALKGIIGVRTLNFRPNFMRPPYGNSNSDTTQTLNKLGYTIVTWSVDSKDYVTHNLTDELANYKSELGPVTGSNGGIALEHDVYQQTVEQMTDQVIAFVKNQGYKFATVAECFNSSPYRN